MRLLELAIRHVALDTAAYPAGSGGKSGSPIANDEGQVWCCVRQRAGSHSTSIAEEMLKCTQHGAHCISKWRDVPRIDDSVSVDMC